jgi:ADP-ribose pyrophosphatase YjhB (NUDIX family)
VFPFKYESIVKLFAVTEGRMIGMSREYPLRPLIGAGALILRDGKLLLVKRGAHPGFGKWSVPGGLVELGEKVQDAMVREVKEEVGFDVEAVKLTDVADTITLDSNGRVQYHFVVVNFVARIVGGELKTATDILEARWVPVGEVDKVDLTGSFRAFFEKHKNEILRLVSV